MINDFYDVFISYGRADSKHLAIKLYESLSQQNFKVWFDQNNIPLAVDFQEQINDGIAKADNFLFIIAPHSVKSEYCLKEIELAVKYKKRIIPLLHVDIEPYFKQVHPTISKLNWLFFQEDKNDYATSLEKLIQLLNQHQDYVHLHTQILVKALDWVEHHRQTRYLLVGKEREQSQVWLKQEFSQEQAPCEPTDLHCEFIGESIKNANNLMTEVFLSYASEDRLIMQKLSATLRRAALTIWTNKTDIRTGSEFQAEINKGIEQADNFVYLLSPNSLQSEYCQQELNYAVANQKRIITLLVTETDLQQIPEQLRSLQFIDLTKYENTPKYTNAINKFLKELYQDAAYYKQQKNFLVQALKWRRQNCNPSILLRGHNLQQAQAWLAVAQQRQEHAPIDTLVEFITKSAQQPPNLQLEVFISYSRADGDFARQLNEALLLQGKSTWFDQESIASGTDFQQEIYSGIANCDNFLFIISPDSINSPYCKDEVEYAKNLNKRFVTILHRPVSPASLHPELAKVQWLDFNQNGGDFHLNFSELVRTLDTDREHVHNHTKLWQEAKEWQQKKYHPDLLLPSSEYTLAKQWLEAAITEKKQPSPTQLQQDFITASKTAIEEEINQEKRQKRILKSLLGLVSTALVAAVSLGVVAWEESNYAKQLLEKQISSQSRYSQLLADSHLDFDALIEGIRAGQLRNELGKVQPETRQQIIDALRRAIYDVREFNRLATYKGIADFSRDGKLIATVSKDKTVKIWEQTLDHRLVLKQTLPHKELVNKIVFSPNSNLIATRTTNNQITIWNLAGEKLPNMAPRPETNSVMVSGMVFSHDSKMLATYCVQYCRTKTAKLWDLETGNNYDLTHDDEVWEVVFSADGKLLATRSKDGTAKVWRLELNRKPTPLHTLQHQDEVWQVQFSGDSRLVATASKDKTAKIWDAVTGNNLQTLPHDDAINGIQFSPDSQMLASYSSGNSQIWHRQRSFIIALDHEDEIKGIEFSPNSQQIVTYSKDKTGVIWNQDGEKLHTLLHTDELQGVSFSADGSKIATYSKDKTAKIWNQEGKQIQTLWHQAAVIRLKSTHTQSTIITQSQDNMIHFWRLNNPYFNSFHGHNDWLWNVQFSPDGEIIATTSKDRTTKLWSRAGKLLTTLWGHDNTVTRAAFSPDGTTIATGSAGTVNLWTRAGEKIATLNNQYSFRFHRDSQIIATSSDSTVNLWNLDGELVNSFNTHDKFLWEYRFSHDGTMIATASEDGTAKVSNLQGEELYTLKSHDKAVRSVNFHPDGKIMVTASNDQTIKIWSLNANKQAILLQTLTGHQGEIRHVSFSQDGKTLVSRSQDNTVKLWQTDSQGNYQLLQTLTHDNNAYIYAIAFSPDGTVIATAGKDGKVKLWNRAGEELETLLHNSAASRLSFSPDGKMIAIVSNQSSLTVWNLDLEQIKQLNNQNIYLDDLMVRACSWVKNYLSNPVVSLEEQLNHSGDAALCD